MEGCTEDFGGRNLHLLETKIDPMRFTGSGGTVEYNLILLQDRSGIKTHITFLMYRFKALKDVVLRYNGRFICTVKKKIICDTFKIISVNLEDANDVFTKNVG